LYLISERLLSATSDKHIYESTSVVLTCADTEFKATGKIIKNNGFKDIEETFNNFMKCKDEQEQAKEEKALPELSENQSFTVTADIAEHYIAPPKPYTEDTLLSAMERAGNSDYDTDEVERKGLGTPATRASIIETLIKRGYIERNKKQILSTEKGKSVIKAVPQKIKSAKMTAEWENRLVLISKGQSDSNGFMSDINDFVKNIISDTKPIEEMKSVFNEKEVIGICPRCKSNIYEGKLNFYCENKECKFALWKKNKFWETKNKEITKTAAKALLKNGKVHYKDLYSSDKNKTYEADILLDDTGNYVNFKLEFMKKG
jgi:DNA topoisomerase-3